MRVDGEVEVDVRAARFRQRDGKLVLDSPVLVRRHVCGIYGICGVCGVGGICSIMVLVVVVGGVGRLNQSDG